MKADNLVPLIELIPPHHTDAQCRSILRSSGKFRPINGRWLFPRRTAPVVQRYLAQH